MVGTPIPVLFLGSNGPTADVWQWDDGITDGEVLAGDGDPIIMLSKSVRASPAGVGGECIFTQFWIALTYDMDAITLRFTPIVDGVVFDGTGGNPDLRQTLALVGVPGTRVTERFEFGMSVPYDDGVSTNAIRTALRGAWFQLQIDQVGGLGNGDLIIEQPEIEYEVVRESLQAQ